MKHVIVPFEHNVINRIFRQVGKDINQMSIRELSEIIKKIEEELQVKYIKTEWGIPGLKASPIAFEREKKALFEDQLASVYPPFEGLPVLKDAAAAFAKAFLNLVVSPQFCIPTSGALQGGYIAIGIAGHLNSNKDTILYLSPTFPVSLYQSKLWGLKMELIELYNYRGNKLYNHLQEKLSKGCTAGLLWSSPNNPSWICLKEEELQKIGELCTKYNVIAIEDHAYLGMDFRQNYGNPYESPYIPTIAQYTQNYLLLISSSKIFSYAGQRVGVLIVSPAVYNLESDNLFGKFGYRKAGSVIVQSLIGSITGGVTSSAQYGLAELLEKAVAGQYNFLDDLKTYSFRSKIMKKAFLENGFSLVYQDDLGEDIGDGFYFTVAYPGYDGYNLIKELLYYGISAFPIASTGSLRSEGLRICSSLITDEDMGELQYRLNKFFQDHPVKN
jgi:aspartate/methionine/tyrosine aminotransferase